MFSAVKLVSAAAIVALFGGFLLSGILTTPQEGVAPAAVTDSASPEATYVAPYPVAGKLLSPSSKFKTYVIVQEEDRRTFRGGGNAYPIEMDDARLSGTLYLFENRDMIGERNKHHDGEVWTGTLELINEDGSWIGAYRGYTTMNPAILHWNMEMTGSDAHEGLSAILKGTGAYGTADLEGLVFPGTLPEYPAPVEVPAE